MAMTVSKKKKKVVLPTEILQLIFEQLSFRDLIWLSSRLSSHCYSIIHSAIAVNLQSRKFYLRAYVRISQRGFVSEDAAMIRLYCMNPWVWNAARRRRDLVSLINGNFKAKDIPPLEFAPDPEAISALISLPNPPWILHVLFSEWGLNDPLVMALHPEGTIESHIDYVIKNPLMDLRCHPFITAEWDTEDEIAYLEEQQQQQHQQQEPFDCLPRVIIGSTPLAKMDFEQRRRQRRRSSLDPSSMITRLFTLPLSARIAAHHRRQSSVNDTVLDKIPLPLVAALEKQFAIQLIVNQKADNSRSILDLRIYAARSFLSVGWLIRDLHAASLPCVHSKPSNDPIGNTLSSWRQWCKWETISRNRGGSWQSNVLDRKRDRCIIL